MAHQKNRQGNTLPLRADLAEELRVWIEEKKLAPTDPLFVVPKGILRILNRDLEDAGIQKVLEGGRKIDIHALRMTFATMLQTNGVAPRVAQAAMRHSDIRLTTNTYTDTTHLPLREAVESLPAIGNQDDSHCTRYCTHDSDFGGHTMASFGKMGNLGKNENQRDDSLILDHQTLENTGNCGEMHEKKSIGLTGFEPATSWSRSITDDDQTPINPEENATPPSDVPPLVPPTENAPLDLARLLTELAKLPPEQRQAIATLLAASQPATPPPPTPARPTRLDDRCSLDELEG